MTDAVIPPSPSDKTADTAEVDLLSGSCHCGAVQLTLPFLPDKATDCNCSLCRRVGGVWAYFEFGTVKIEGHPDHTTDYVWGDKCLRTVRCAHCGSVTHWEPIDGAPGSKHGVNLAMFPPQILQHVKVRRFDGADTWTFLDE